MIVGSRARLTRQYVRWEAEKKGLAKGGLRVRICSITTVVVATILVVVAAGLVVVAAGLVVVPTVLVVVSAILVVIAATLTIAVAAEPIVLNERVNMSNRKVG